jgi:hypothetical protein
MPISQENRQTPGWASEGNICGAKGGRLVCGLGLVTAPARVRTAAATSAQKTRAANIATAKSAAGMWNTASAVLGVLAIAADLSGDEVAGAVLLGASVITCGTGAAITCSVSWGSDSCNLDIGLTAMGVLSGGVGIWAQRAHLIPKTATVVEKFFGTGGLGAVPAIANCVVSTIGSGHLCP